MLDFGIAKLVADTQTMGTGAIGSPAWMAPEQAEAGQSITPAADVWALGLLTFWMLTGKMFWKSARHQSASMHAFLKEVLFEPVPLASDRADETAGRLPEGFDGWFERCVHREPRARFADARAALEGFRPLIDPAAADDDAAPVDATGDMSTAAFIESQDLPTDPSVDDAGQEPPADVAADVAATPEDVDDEPSEEPEPAPVEPAPVEPVIESKTNAAMVQATVVTPKKSSGLGAVGIVAIVAVLGIFVVGALFFVGTPQSSDPTVSVEGPTPVVAPVVDTVEPTEVTPPPELSAAPDPTAKHASRPAPAPGPAPAPATAPSASASADEDKKERPFPSFHAKQRVKLTAQMASRQCKRKGGPEQIAVTVLFGNDGRVKDVQMNRKDRFSPAGACVHMMMKTPIIHWFTGEAEAIGATVQTAL